MIRKSVLQQPFPEEGEIEDIALDKKVFACLQVSCQEKFQPWLPEPWTGSAPSSQSDFCQERGGGSPGEPGS